MIPEMDALLRAALQERKHQGLYRSLRDVGSPVGAEFLLDEKRVINFASNDYLGLANEDSLKEAAARAAHDFGAGSAASRLISGSLSVHRELEEMLAAFKGAEAAIAFSSGYAAAIGTVCALVGRGDVVIVDKLVHASIVDGARLSGAKLRVFPHNDLGRLEEMLQWARQRASLPDHADHGRVLVITESIFSMDGDPAPLAEIVRLKNKWGAWLMVDEAHATGIFGSGRRGLIEELHLDGQVEIQMGTLGKAVGAAGGYICGSRTLIDYLVNFARSFIFSTAPVPAAAAAASAGLRFIQSIEGKKRVEALWDRINQAKAASLARGTPIGSPIVPILIGSETEAVRQAELLLKNGIFVPAVRYPTVAKGKARLRISLSAAHSAEQVRQLVGGLQRQPLM